MSVRKVYDYIDAHVDDFVDDLVKLVKQPSVSAKGEGVQECAELVEKMMKEIGFSTKILREKKGNPVVYGELKSKKTLLFYDHYDVQPPDPLEKWTYKPFSGKISGGKIYGRGTSDNKGNFVSRLKAVQALLEVTGDVPGNIKIFVEGEEEIGSPHLEPIVKKHKNLFSADAAIWEFGGTDRSGRPVLHLGLKGVLSVELKAKGASKDVHSANAPLIPNPAWCLIWALNLLKDEGENILIDGFYDDILSPSREEIECMRKIPFEEEETKKELGLRKFLRGKSGLEAQKALLYQPTCTINGLISGYTSKGSKTVLPHEASAKMDFRLVPNQQSDDIFKKLVNHLKKHGFRDLKIIKHGSTEPTRTPIDDPFVGLVAKTARKVYGRKAVIYPISAGSGPMHLFRNFLGYPVVSAGCSHPESNTHAPNENLKIESYIKGTKFIATLVTDFTS
ncbi:MAG: M20/M25/M40 family metallo-hydrolase [Candidatus Bathyarchaeota archaeon]|nr:M20/M25/M40 family metallo-hydrolase [Candidatus Bathyarchaeota archaeon]MDH5787365.1 M20/M25/M40 family metallo-hydrolase [Candidatus Bathyarchaeota archaeon]